LRDSFKEVVTKLQRDEHFWESVFVSLLHLWLCLNWDACSITPGLGWEMPYEYGVSFLPFFLHFIAGNLVWLLICLEIWFLTTTQQCARLFMIGFVPKFE
jgi:hypothetical protein